MKKIFPYLVTFFALTLLSAILGVVFILSLSTLSGLICFSIGGGFLVSLIAAFIIALIQVKKRKE